MFGLKMPRKTYQLPNCPNCGKNNHFWRITRDWYSQLRYWEPVRRRQWATCPKCGIQVRLTTHEEFGTAGFRSKAGVYIE